MNQPEQLGPYRIESVLGKGGMGRVYRATHLETGDAVAIKALSPQLAMNDGFIERFRAEIDSLRRLRHASIVRLFGYGQEGDLLFYAMELVDGPSLDNEIRQGRRFDWREVTDIAAQLCRALQHAHDHGIVHRDIKPANILIAPSGQIKLADFGIARLFGGSQLTVAGGVIGTADYMSPEQVSGESVTPQCDQYSLGGVMYTLLAGRPPFVSKSLPEMLQMQRYDTPEPVRRYAPDTPEQLEETIAQMLSKAPDDRFPNTRVLARHLEAMRIALSRPPVELGDELASDLGMTRPIGPSDVTRPYDLSREDDSTLHSLELPIDSDAEDTNDVTPVTAAMATGAGHREESTLVAIEKSVSGPAPKTSLFTEVHDEHPAETGSRWGAAAQGVVAVAVLALAGWLAYGWFAPPGADALHATIDEALGTGNAESLRTAAPHVESFLARFPDDPRAASLRSVQQAIEANRHERRLKLKLLLRRGPDRAAPPVEQLYLAAMQRAVTSPAAAIDQLQAIVTLVEAGDAAQEQESLQEYAALARRQIEQLRQAAEAEQAAHRPFIESQLARARELATDQPAETRHLCEALVALYADRPWAAELLADARSIAASTTPAE